MTTSPENMIEIKSLYKKFGKIQALNNLNLNIKKGELLGIIGHNGAGKTTTIRIISCILHPDKGTVLVNNLNIKEKPIEIKSMIGYLPEEPNLYERFTAYDLLKYFGELYNVPSKTLDKRIDELLELVNMSDRKHDKINTFSKGLRQRIGIARSLIHDPEIIIFDEPTMGLDPATASSIRNFILTLKGKKTILLCTHYMEEADLLCDRVAIINHGEILDIDTPKNLKSKIHGDLILNIELKKDVETEKLNKIKNIDGAENIELMDNTLTVSLSSEDLISKIITILDNNIKSVNTKKPTLNDVFIQRIKNEQWKKKLGC